MTSQARDAATPEIDQNAKESSPTDSHFLSHTKEHEDIVTTPNSNGAYEGWTALSKRDVKERIIPTIPNEDLWMLIRRFNKVKRPVIIYAYNGISADKLRCSKCFAREQYQMLRQMD